MGFKFGKQGLKRGPFGGPKRGVLAPPGTPQNPGFGTPHRAEIQGFYKPGATTVEAHVAKRLLGMGGGGGGD